MIVATAGHVDHGKTSLVQALTGVDTDRLKEEKQRGLTIDLGFAYTNTETGHRIGFVDVPGHIRFINNMLAGVSAIDLALLVVAADDGVMPQTREHLDVLQILGIPAGVIALTKTDRVAPERIDVVLAEIEQLVAATFLEGAEVYPVSCLTGDGMDTLQLALDIAVEETRAKAESGYFRLAIDRRFTVRGSGIVATGSVFAGTAAIGDTLLLQPQGAQVRIRGLHTQNQEAEKTTTGDRCAVNLGSARFDVDSIHRGNWLTDNPGTATDRADMQLTLLPNEEAALTHWAPVHIHTAANHVTGRVAILEGRKIAPGESALVQLVMDQAINLCTGDRVVLRDQAATRTLGGGMVVDPWSPKRGRARQDRLAYLRQIEPANPAASLAAVIATGNAGIDVTNFGMAFNLRPDEVDELLTDVDVEHLGEALVIGTKHLAEACTQLADSLRAWHEDNPGKPGIPLNQLAGLQRKWPKPLLERVVSDLLRDNKLEQQGNQYRLPGQGVQLNAREQATLEKALPLLGDDSLKPPVLHDLAKTLGQDPKSLERILVQAVKAGMLIRPVKNRFFLPEAMQTLRAMVTEAADTEGKLSVQAYRDKAGIGRNLSIEILEYFDRQGVTRRIGETRQVIER